MNNLTDWVRREVFARLWDHYNSLVPYGPKIMSALAKRGDVWIEDHVAYRTLPGPHTGAHVLEEIFKLLGYVRKDDYFFDAKQLKAFWMCPPDIKGHTLDASPKIFISELIPDKFSSDFQEVVSKLTTSVRTSPLYSIRKLSADTCMGDCYAAEQLVAECTKFLTSLPSWTRPSYKDYDILSSESEYAAWTMLYGNQINHFTLSVHLMKTFGSSSESSIAHLARFIEEVLHIPMNHSGGTIKGTPELQLEQIATRAAECPYLFQDGIKSMPYGFVEFAYRHTLPNMVPDGMWSSYYQGFVTSNADKIFESTYQQSKEN